jgi:hypothetical protein
MKVRVKKISNFWYGQVYGEWKSILLDKHWTGWENVTENCFTYAGAWIQLKKWIHENNPKEYDI